MWMLIERAVAVPMLGVLFYLVGCFVLRAGGAFRPSIWTADSSRAQAILDRLLAGTAGLVLVLFATAAIGLYRPVPLIGLTCLLALFGLAAAFGERELERAAPQESETGEEAVPSTSSARWLIRLGLIGWSLLFALLWLQSIRPDIGWDSNVYHLSVPKQFLREGRFLAIPMNVYSHWPLGVDLLFGWAMALRDHVLAKQVHYLFALFTAGLLFVLGTRAGTTSTSGTMATTKAPLRSLPSTAVFTGLLAVGLFFANPVVLFEARVAYVDIAFAFFALGAAWAAERSLASPDHEQRGSLLLLGIAAGLACATKLSGAFTAGAILLVWAVATLRRQGLGTTWRRALAVAPTVLLLGGIWPLKSWWLTGNPVYPLLYGQFGGPDWSENLAIQHAAWQKTMGMGHELLDYLLLPWRVIVHGGNGYQNFDGRLHLVWLLALPVIAWGAFRSDRVRRLGAVALLIFISWALTSQQARLLIPCLGILAWATVEAVHAIGAHRRRITDVAVTLACFTLLGFTWFEARTYVQQAPSLAKRLAQLGYDANDAVIHPIYRAVDELPPTSRLLLLNTNHGFYLERPYLADSFFEASQIVDLLAPTQDAETALGRLRRRGVSHVLLQVRADGGMVYPPALVELLQARRWTRVVYESPDGRYVLFELAREGTRFGS